MLAYYVASEITEADDQRKAICLQKGVQLPITITISVLSWLNNRCASATEQANKMLQFNISTGGVNQFLSGENFRLRHIAGRENNIVHNTSSSYWQHKSLYNPIYIRLDRRQGKNSMGNALDRIVY